jgi:hypothetical protein
MFSWDMLLNLRLYVVFWSPLFDFSFFFFLKVDLFHLFTLYVHCICFVYYSSSQYRLNIVLKYAVILDIIVKLL